MDKSLGHMGSDRIRRAFASVGKKVKSPVEMVVVGGAAGLLTGMLPSVVTTGDVDAIHFRPSIEVESVLEAADQVAREEGLERGWLNVDAGLYAFALPDGWEERRLSIGEFGNLRIWALGRFDQIAMKFFAHREADLGHLLRMKVTAREIKEIAKYLNALMERVPSERNRIEMAIRLADEWETQ